MKAPVVVYGASGYTGKLISWHLAQEKIPFLAGGRSQQRLEQQMEKVPELRGHDYSCQAANHDVESLTKLFTGAKIVYNVTGPFMQIGEPVVQAALAAGCHYLDTTGEADWMRFIRDKYGKEFASKKLVLAPACSYMWAAGNITAEIALETPGIDSVEMLYFPDSNTSVASTQSFLRMCTRPQYFIHNRKLEMWPMATAYPVKTPDSHRIYRALPWSGGGEAVWYENDPRVTNCSTLVAFKSDVMFGAVIKVLEEFEVKYRSLPEADQEKACFELGAAITTVEPGRENPDVNRLTQSCLGWGNTNGVSVVCRGNSGYLQTAAYAAEACRRILAGKLLGVGFQSPAKAFGARNLLACCADRGYTRWESQPV